MLLLEKALLSRGGWPLSLGWRQCLWIHGRDFQHRHAGAKAWEIDFTTGLTKWIRLRRAAF